jgi:non-specific protein-tyrosine kinase
METLVRMKNRCPDRNVLSASPCLAAPTPSLAPLVDHIVFVVEADRTSARDVERALDLLPKEKILGMVLNRHKPTKKESTYYNSYYPKYYYKK